MKVLYFSRDYTTHDHRFLARLARSRHDIWFMRLGNDGIKYEERPVPHGIQVVEWRGGQEPIDTLEDLLKLMPEFENALLRLSPDLVHAGPVQSCGFMTALTGFHPFLAVSWASDILVDAGRDRVWSWMTRYTLSRSDLFLCDCQAVRLKAQHMTSYPDDRVIQFPWGTDLRRFSPGADASEMRRTLGWEDAFVVLATRSWNVVHGIEVLLEAFRRAYTQNARLRLLLLGNGPPW